SWQTLQYACVRSLPPRGRTRERPRRAPASWVRGQNAEVRRQRSENRLPACLVLTLVCSLTSVFCSLFPHAALLRARGGFGPPLSRVRASPCQSLRTTRCQLWDRAFALRLFPFRPNSSPSMRKSLQLGEVLPLARVLLFSGIASFLQLEPFGLVREFASIS